MYNNSMSDEEKSIKFTWRKEWIREFESPWGIIERFKFANMVTGTDVIRVLGNEDTALHPTRKKSQDLIQMKELDQEKMKSILGVSLIEHANRFYKKFLEPLQDADGYYLRKDLAFCEECMKIGYHSFFHQFILLEDCPFHKRKLLTKCPECGSSIPYEINTDLFKFPFTCRCGRAIFIERMPYSFIELWEKGDMPKFEMPEIAIWWNWNMNSQKKLEDIFLFPKISSLRGGRTISNLLNVINGTTMKSSNSTNNMPIKCTVRSGTLRSVLPELPPSKLVIDYRKYVEAEPHIKQKWTITTKMIDELSFSSYINLCMYQNFKSIARHIKNTVLAKHKKCIRLYKHHSFNTCPNTLAYFLWRREIELRKPKVFDIWISTCAFEDILSSEINKILKWLNIKDDRGLADYHRLWPIVTWIYNRLFSHYLLERFNSYLELCQSTYSNKDKYDKLTLNGINKENVSSDYPVFIIERHFFTLDKQEISVHWFISEAMSQRSVDLRTRLLGS